MSEELHLNVTTALYPENRRGGLMICGINWGGDPTKPQVKEESSFFSDALVNNYRYRNRLVHWFELFGHPLATKRGSEGPFERSIAQTNWLSDQAVNMRGIDLVTLCSKTPEAFLYHLDQLRPRLIILVGSSLFHALNSPDLLPRIESLIGKAEEAQRLEPARADTAKPYKAFMVGRRRFTGADVLALPHPTGSTGLADGYIASFRPKIEPMLSHFKQQLAAG